MERRSEGAAPLHLCTSAPLLASMQPVYVLCMHPQCSPVWSSVVLQWKRRIPSCYCCYTSCQRTLFSSVQYSILPFVLRFGLTRYYYIRKHTRTNTYPYTTYMPIDKHTAAHPVSYLQSDNPTASFSLWSAPSSPGVETIPPLRSFR